MRTAVSILSSLAALAVATTAAAQPDSGHMTGAGAAPSVSANGQLSLSIPVTLPATRGGVPAPFGIGYTGSMRVGDLGVGWSTSVPHVSRTSNLAGTRPRFNDDPNASPQPIDRLYLSFGGSSMAMVAESPGVYRPMMGPITLTLVQQHGYWVLHDGTGNQYTFRADPRLPHNGLWMLDEVNDASGNNPVRYLWNVNAVDAGNGDVAYEVNLGAIELNEHPTAGCFKHRVEFTWAPPFGTPDVLSLAASSGSLRARVSVLTAIDTRAHGDVCATDAARKRLSGYRFAYERDRDTGLPRLAAVDMVGEEGVGTDARLPVGRYQYGSLTTHDRLIYLQSETVVDPAVPHQLAPMVSSSNRGDGESFPRFIDLTGDGRADHLADRGNEWVYLPARGDSVAAVGPPRAKFDDARSLGLASGAVHKAGNGPSVPDDMVLRTDTHTQLIDFNADGRIDVLTSEDNDAWTLKLNLPARVFDTTADASDILWDERAIPTSGLRQRLISRKLLPQGFAGPVPLARTASMATTDVRGPGTDPYDENGNPRVPWGCSGFPPGTIGTRSHEEWSLRDVNGDGYPDLVTNELPTGSIVWKTIDCDPDHAVVDEVHAHNLAFVVDPAGHEPAPVQNRLLVELNKAGNYAFDDVWPFAAHTIIDDVEGCAVEEWNSSHLVDLVPGDPVERYQACGFLPDMNGDGMVDFLARRDLPGSNAAYARLGTGVGFHGALRMGRRPAIVTTEPSCSTDPNQDTFRVSGSLYLDVTGDGIADHVGVDHVRIGTGTGWTDWIPAQDLSADVFASTARCEPGSYLSMTAGLYEIDGDGRLDIVRATPYGWDIHRLSNGTGLGAYDAGRLTRFENGYGAALEIRYASAKNDPYGDHHVPFAEIVVAETTMHVDGSSEQPMRYAYGNSRMRFDAVADRWVATGFGRRVSVRGYTRSNRIDGIADIVDVHRSDNRADTYDEYAHNGRTRLRMRLDGRLPTDIWRLLDYESDPALESLINQSTSYTWASRKRMGGPDDCIQFPGYILASELPSSPLSINGRYDRPCTSIGFAYVEQTDAWQGNPAFAGQAVFSRTRVTDIDWYGRPLGIARDNDLKDDLLGPGSDDEALAGLADRDNVCIDITYDSPAAWMYHAVETQTVRDCAQPNQGDNTRALARSAFEHDSLGRLVRTTSDRFETSQGLFQDRADSRVGYDAFSNVTSQTEVGSGVERVTSSTGFDPFYLAAHTGAVSSNDPNLPVLTSTTESDPYSLVPRSVTNHDGTTTTADYDEFGRQVSAGLIPAGESAEILVAENRYVGYEVGSTGSRFVEEIAYLTEAGGDIAKTRSHADGLGRARHQTVYLGADYGQNLITGQKSFDGLGRLAYVADPYIHGETGVHYGTSFHYNTDGSLKCEIRAPGRVGLITTTDESAGIYPTCYERDYVDQNVVMRMYSPSDLEAGLDADTPHWQEVLSGMGRVLQRARIDDSGERLELVRFGYDKLGHSRTVARYADPAAAAQPVTWSFVRDTDGNALVTSEPTTAPIFADFDALGRMVSTTWDDRAGNHEIRYTYDAFDRLRQRVDYLDGAARPETLVQYHYDRSSTDPRFGHRVGRLSNALSFDAAGNPTMEVEYGYDALGRTRAVTRTGGDGQAFHEDYTYRLDGQLDSVSLRLPDNGHQPESASYAYDSIGRLRDVTWMDAQVTENVMSVPDIDAFGRPKEVRYGNGTVEKYTYRADRNRELTSTYFRATNGAERATNIVDYTADMRVAERIDTEVSATGQLRMESHAFTYDALRNLRTSTVTDLAGGGSPMRSQEYGYDALGNLRSVDDLEAARDVSIDYRQDDPDRVCRTEPAAPGPAPAPPPAPPPSEPGFHWFEAESGRVSAPMVVRVDSSRSGGGFVELPQGAGNGLGSVEFEVEIAEAGPYVLMGKVRAPDNQSNSFRVWTDTGQDFSWHPHTSSDFRWRTVTRGNNNGSPATMWFSTGTHRIRIEGRDAGAQLDRLLLTLDHGFNPAGNEPPTTPTLAAGEAEAGAGGATYVVDLDASASAGEHLAIPAGVPAPSPAPGDHASIAVVVESAGHYQLWLRVRTSGEADDTTTVSVDGGPAITWHAGHAPDWALRQVSALGPMWLEPGTHTLELGHVESGIEIDLVVLTSHLTAVPAPTLAAAADTCQYRYDERGNVVTTASSSGPSRHFAFDGLSRVSSIASGERVASYTYGPEGDVIGFQLRDPNLVDSRDDRHYGPHVSQSWFADGASSRQLIERRIPGVPMARRGPGAETRVVYSHADSAGVRRTTDHTGVISQELTYNPYGGLVTDTGDPNSIAGTQAGFNFGDHLRDLDVVQIGARIYDPRTGRFLQRDPLIITRTATMMNPYAFAWNDPVNITDYSGMDPLFDCAGDECRPGEGPITQPDNDAPFHWPIFDPTSDLNALDEEARRLAAASFGLHRLKLEEIAARYGNRRDVRRGIDAYHRVVDAIEANVLRGEEIDLRRLWQQSGGYSWADDAWTRIGDAQTPSFEATGIGNVAGYDSRAIWSATSGRSNPDPTILDRVLDAAVQAPFVWLAARNPTRGVVGRGIGATRVRRRSPFNPTDGRTNCVACVTSLVDSIENGGFVMGANGYTGGAGRFPTMRKALEFVSHHTGVTFGARTLNRLGSPGDYIVFNRFEAGRPQHVLWARVRSNGSSYFYDPQIGRRVPAGDVGSYSAYRIGGN